MNEDVQHLQEMLDNEKARHHQHVQHRISRRKTSQMTSQMEPPHTILNEEKETNVTPTETSMSGDSNAGSSTPST